MKILARGAEAVLRLEGREGRKVLVKDRISKGYRVPELDRAIRTQRTRTEERMLSRARRAGVKAPVIWESGETGITMEFVEGPTVKESLNGMAARERKEVCRQMGEAAARLHAAGIVHGDLTTSNMIVSTKEGGGEDRVHLIDFGLAKASRRVEDQAVDLFLLHEALKAAHFRFLGECWKTIINAYKHNYTIAGKVLDRLERIERRRRYRGG